MSLVSPPRHTWPGFDQRQPVGEALGPETFRSGISELARLSFDPGVFVVALAVGLILCTEVLAMGIGLVWSVAGLLHLPPLVETALDPAIVLASLLAGSWLFVKAYAAEWRLARRIAVPGDEDAA